MTDESNMYACLYGLAESWESKKILEIGTGFGLSTMALLSPRMDIELLTMDRGDFMGLDNITLAKRIVGADDRRIDCWQADTQWPMSVAHVIKRKIAWQEPYDLLYVDGCHDDDALFRDLYTFWPFIRPGGLVICDDIHNPTKYPQFDWVPDTWDCFHAFLDTPGIHWNEMSIWDFPFVPSGRRPLGLIVKE